MQRYLFASSFSLPSLLKLTMLCFQLSLTCCSEQKARWSSEQINIDRLFKKNQNQLNLQMLDNSLILFFSSEEIV